MTSKSVRVAEDTFERLQQLAEEEDRPMARIVGGAVELYDQIKLAKVTSGGTKQAPESPKTLVVGPSGEDTPETAKTGCPHPKERLRVLSWGTVCRDCGTVVK